MSRLNTLFDETSGRLDRGIPCLIGESQWGKTWNAHNWSESRGRTLITLLCQSQEPEAIFGYDVKHPTTGELIWAPPSWLKPIMESPKKKWTIFIDELDKAREAVQSTILTLLCNGTVRDYVLPKTVAIICAMNPPRSPLPKALVERLLFVAYPTTEDLSSTIIPAMGSIKSIAADYLEPPKVAFPEKHKNAGTLFRLKSWTQCDQFWKDDDFRHMIITGLVPVKDVAWMLSRFDPKAFMGLDLVEWAKNASPADLEDSLINVLQQEKDHQKRFDILQVICERANKDESGEFSKVIAELAIKKLHQVN